MKFFDNWNGCDTLSRFALELTRVPPLWNYRKTAEVAQALLPVPFSCTRKLQLQLASVLASAADETHPKPRFLRRNICRSVFVR